MSWWTDPRMLAAGNARGLPGGDPDAMPGSPTSGAPAGSSYTGAPVYAADTDPLSRDLASLARARRVLVASHRAPRRTLRQIVAGWKR